MTDTWVLVVRRQTDGAWETAWLTEISTKGNVLILGFGCFRSMNVTKDFIILPMPLNRNLKFIFQPLYSVCICHWTQLVCFLLSCCFSDWTGSFSSKCFNVNANSCFNGPIPAATGHTIYMPTDVHVLVLREETEGSRKNWHRKHHKGHRPASEASVLPEATVKTAKPPRGEPEADPGLTAGTTFPIMPWTLRSPGRRTLTLYSGCGVASDKSKKAIINKYPTWLRFHCFRLFFVLDRPSATSAAFNVLQLENRCCCLTQKTKQKMCLSLRRLQQSYKLNKTSDLIWTTASMRKWSFIAVSWKLSRTKKKPGSTRAWTQASLQPQFWKRDAKIIPRKSFQLENTSFCPWLRLRKEQWHTRVRDPKKWFLYSDKLDKKEKLHIIVHKV